MQKKDILARLQTLRNPTTFSKSNLLESVQPKKVEVKSEKQLIQSVLENHVSEKQYWKPQKTNTKEIWTRWLVEATEANSTDRSNAMRLNLQPISLNNSHLKFTFVRNGSTITSEIMYPNKNNNITVKVSVTGADDNIKEVNIDDAEYTNGLGFTIIKMADESLENASIVNDEYDDVGMPMDYGTVKGGHGVSGSMPNWSTKSGLWESDFRRMNNMMTLVEQEENEEEKDPANAGDVNAGNPDEPSPFGDDDFSSDVSGALEMGDNLSGGGSFGGGGFGGGGGGDFSGGETGADEGSAPAESEGGEMDSYANFSSESMALPTGAIEGMKNIISKEMANSMMGGDSQAGGIKMTAEQIRKGYPGIESQKNANTIKQFLDIYSELKDLQISKKWFDEINDALASDNGMGSFDAFLKENLSEIRGDADVNDVVNLPSEQNVSIPEPDDSMMGNEPGPGEVVPPTLTQETNGAEEKTPDELEAENDVNIPKINEFPGV